MKLACLLPFSLLCVGAFAQDSDLFDKAPPQVDEALRARVMLFYEAHMSGHFRDAYQVVAEDAQDDFLMASKDKFSDCQIKKIVYSESFTKAVVTTACKTEYRWHGQHMPVTIPLLSNWKLESAKWFWWHPKVTEVQTPWGVSKVTPDDVDKANKMPEIPKDPEAAARDILSKVSVDKPEVELKSYELSKAEVHVTNAMPGGISVSVEALPYPGLKAKVVPEDLGQGGKATVTFSYDPKDPAILCGACTAKAILPVLTANIRIMPTGQVLPVKISFAVVPPEPKKPAK